MKKTSSFSEEELAIGIVFKNLREAKDFSQAEACGDETSVPHLSNFEGGKTNITTSRFIALLNNINVNMFEFQNSYNQYLHSKDVLLFNTEVTEAVMEQNPVQLKLLSKQIEEQLLLKPNDKKLKLDNIRIKSVLYFVDPSYSITKSDSSFLVEYLYNLKEWGLYDIRLLSQSAQFIDVLKLSELTNRMLNPMQENHNLEYIKLARIRCILNIINAFVDNEIYEPARRFIKYLEDSEVHEYFMFEKLTLIYNKANYSYHTGDKSALNIMKKCQEVLEFCGCSKIASQVSSELENLRKN